MHNATYRCIEISFKRVDFKFRVTMSLLYRVGDTGTKKKLKETKEKRLVFNNIYLIDEFMASYSKIFYLFVGGPQYGGRKPGRSR